MTNTITERYIRFYMKNGRCILEIPVSHVLEVNVACEGNYSYQQYCGGKKLHMVRELYHMKSMDIVMIPPSDEIDFAVWWKNNYKLMQNLGWIDIDASKKCTIRYTIDDMKINVYFEHSDTYNESTITIEGV